MSSARGGSSNSYYDIVGMIEEIPGIGLARIEACRTAWDLGARSIDDVLEAARITGTLANTVRSTVEAKLEARRLFQQRVELGERAVFGRSAPRAPLTSRANFQWDCPPPCTQHGISGQLLACPLCN
ncbi:hypothetical protein T492DRAFT_872397, partial [Pavlovales sp. CCMP2436]